MFINKGPFTNYVCIFWNFLTTYAPICTFYVVNYMFFWPPTQYPPLIANVCNF